VAKGRLKSLIIYGKPGTGKTHIVRRTFYFANMRPRTDYVIEKGSSLGLAETYQLFYDNRDKTIQQLLASGCGCKGYVPNGVQSPVEFMADLKLVYQANTKEIAELCLDDLEAK
jgi:hypothetical protein